jgi:hypothetical protein
MLVSRSFLFRWQSSLEFRLLRVAVCFTFLQSLTLADAPSDKPVNYPAWWFNQAVIVPITTHTPPSWSGGDYPVPDDFALANIGQLKNFAGAAAAELNANLPGGAGPQINSLIASWNAAGPGRDDFACVNLGQLKNVATIFYDQLVAVRYTDNYPWITTGQNADDYALANLGQLKSIFSFDVAYSSTGNGIPDWWALYCYGTTALNAGDPDGLGDDLTILEAFKAGLTPDFYQGSPPRLTVISGDNQVGAINSPLPSPLVLEVTDSAGHPIANAPVTVTISAGSISGSGSSAGNTIRLNADANGLVSLTVSSPAYQTSFTITANAQSGGQSTSVSFSAATDSSLTSSGSGSGLPPDVPEPQAPSESPRPFMEVQTSNISTANPAFPPFVPTDPPVWYTTMTSDSNFNEYSDTKNADGTEIDYFDGGDFHTEETVRYGYMSMTGYSHFNASLTGAAPYGPQQLPADYTIGATSNIVNDPLNGFVWSGYSTNTGAAAPSYPLSGPAWPGFWSQLSGAPTPQTITYYEDSTIFPNGGGSYSGQSTLSNAYPAQQFAQDVASALPPLSGWQNGPGFGASLAGFHMPDSQQTCSVAKAVYRFRVSPFSLPRSQGTQAPSASTPNPTYQWYEVFQPIGQNQFSQMRQRTWTDAGGASATSVEYPLNPNLGQKGDWYLVRIEITEDSNFPSCKWRDTIGAGESLTVNIVGLPATMSQNVTWTPVSGDDAKDGRSLAPDVLTPTRATFTAGNLATDVVISASAGGTLFSVVLHVKIPTGILYKKVQNQQYGNQQVGAGMVIAATVEPPDVSFRGLVVSETPCQPQELFGAYTISPANGGVTAPIHSPLGNPDGTSNPNERRWNLIWDDNEIQNYDRPATGTETLVPGVGGVQYMISPNYTAGWGLTWNIPCVYKLKDGTSSYDPTGVGFPFVTNPTVSQKSHVNPRQPWQAGVNKMGIGVNPQPISTVHSVTLMSTH